MPQTLYGSHRTLTRQALTELDNNDGMIGSEVAPYFDVGTDEFEIQIRSTAERLQDYGIEVGQTGEIPVVDVGGEMKRFSTKDYALQMIVPNKLVKKYEAGEIGIDPYSDAVTTLMDYMRLAYEIRVYLHYSDTDNYASDLQETLSTDDRISNTTSDPIKKITDALDKPYMRPNTMVMSIDVWRHLRRHPKVINAIRKTGAGGVTDSGVVSRSGVVDLFEVDNIYVGAAWHNTAAKGQTPSIGRLWGNDLYLVYLNKMRNSGLTVPASFCYTAHPGQMLEARTREISERGSYGSTGVVLAETHNIISPTSRAGYNLIGAIAA